MQPNMRRLEPRRSSLVQVSRSRRAPKGQRGAIAMMAAVVIAFILFPMLGLVTMTGFLFNARRQLTNYADSVSAAWGLQMVQISKFDHSLKYFDEEAMANSQGYTGNKPSSTLLRIQYVSDINFGEYDRYTPAYIDVRSAAPYQLANLTRSWFPSFDLDQLRVPSRVRVNQVTLRDHILIRQPVMLMMDFSSTMRLPYEGPNGASSGESAEEALKRVAKTLIEDSSYVYDLGIMGFSDGDRDQRYVEKPGGLTNASNPAEALRNEENRRNTMGQDVSGWRADGDGTNIEAAIEKAGSLLSEAEVPNFPLQNPLMIIVTDGEPNLSRSATKGGGDGLAALQERAANDAKAAMDGQRGAQKDGFPAGVSALVLQIQREQKAGLGQADEDFLRALAGPATGNRGGDSNYFHQDGGDPNRLAQYMLEMPKNPLCVFYNPLNAVPGFRSNNASGPVPNQDVIGAFVAIDGQNGSQDEIQIDPNNIFTDRDKFNKWASDRAHAAYLTSGADPSRQTITTEPLGHGNTQGIDVLRNFSSQFLGLWFDPSTKQIMVSGMLCAAMHLPLLNTPTPIRLRVRWGYPQLAHPDDSVRSGL